MSITQKTTHSVIIESITCTHPDVSVILAFARDIEQALEQGLIAPNERVSISSGPRHLSIRKSVTS
jgi:hypothetical protein